MHRSTSKLPEGEKNTTGHYHQPCGKDGDSNGSSRVEGDRIVTKWGHVDRQGRARDTMCGRHSQTHRQRHRHTDRQTQRHTGRDRQTGTDTYRQRDIQTGKYACTKTDRHRDTQTTHSLRMRGTEAHRQRDRHTCRERHTDTGTNVENTNPPTKSKNFRTGTRALAASSNFPTRMYPCRVLQSSMTVQARSPPPAPQGNIQFGGGSGSAMMGARQQGAGMGLTRTPVRSAQPSGPSVHEHFSWCWSQSW